MTTKIGTKPSFDGVLCETQLMNRIAVGPGYRSCSAELGWAEFGGAVALSTVAAENIVQLEV